MPAFRRIVYLPNALSIPGFRRQFSEKKKDVAAILRLQKSWPRLESRQSLQTEQPKVMYFGVDYYPEHWVYPYAGTPEKPESRWQQDAEMMVDAGVNVVRMGEFSWGLCEPAEGKYDFDWLKRAMDVMAKAGIKVVLGTPTAAPPIWLAKKYPEILPLAERGLTRHEGTPPAGCLSSDVYWDFGRPIIRPIAAALA